MYTIFRYLPLAALLLSQAVMANPGLPQETIQNIYNATLEVVVKKIDRDSLSYKERLPNELIPFQIRNDKYWSIGTAFAIGPNTFVSAAHVFGLGNETLYKDFALRDTSGKVYAMDKVIKYVDNRDLIVFTTKSLKVKEPLQVNTSPSLNSKVFAVGNAHGEGVIIRDGLYTSKTPEERDGKWSWLRFSAAASPGNSGGPLLDEKGQVIGIVLRKSENENLNFALPISEVLGAKKNLAVTDARMKYTMENLNIEKVADFKHTIKLPLPFNKLHAELVKTNHNYADKLMNEMLAENSKSIFPNKNSEDMLHRTYNATFPHIIWQKDDGNFAPYTPNDIKLARLENNGFLQYGKLGDTFIYRIKKPDNVPLNKMLDNGKQMMDYLLKAINYERNIGGKNIRVTSLGKPVMTKKFTDNYNRKWIIHKWQIEFDDSAVVTMTLPTPGGSVTLMRSAGMSTIHSHLSDLKVLTDYAYISYYGTLKQWTEYLAMGNKQLPAAMKNIRLRYNPGKRFAFGSKEIMMTFDTKVQNISHNSDLKLYFSYFQRQGKVVWDLASLSIGENKDTGTSFQVIRNLRPDDGMSDEHKSNWRRLVQQDFPFNKVSYFKNKGTHIGTIYTKGDTKQLEKNKVLYSIFHSIEGKKDETEVKQKIDAFMQALKIPDA